LLADTVHFVLFSHGSRRATRTISVEFAVTSAAVLVGTVLLGYTLTIVQTFGAAAACWC
jgi:hypothetical protein